MYRKQNLSTSWLKLCVVPLTGDHTQSKSARTDFQDMECEWETVHSGYYKPVIILNFLLSSVCLDMLGDLNSSDKVKQQDSSWCQSSYSHSESLSSRVSLICFPKIFLHLFLSLSLLFLCISLHPSQGLSPAPILMSRLGKVYHVYPLYCRNTQNKK